MTVVLVLLALIFPGQSAQTLPASAPNRIESVRVDGNRRITQDTIKYYIQSKVGADLDEALIQRDVKGLYALGYFDDIRVDEEEGKNGGTNLVFFVHEKPLIRSIDYKGLKSVTKSEVLEELRTKKVGLSVESPYDEIRTKKAEAVLKAMLAEKGHQNATVAVASESIPPNFVGLMLNIE